MTGTLARCALLSVLLGLSACTPRDRGANGEDSAARPPSTGQRAFPDPEALVRIEVEYSAGMVHLQVVITRTGFSYRKSDHGPGEYLQRELTSESFIQIAADLISTGVFSPAKYAEYHYDHQDMPYSISVYDTLGTKHTRYVPHSHTVARSGGNTAPNKIGQWLESLRNAD